LEIIGDSGSLILEDGIINVLRAGENVRTHCQSTHEMFGMPAFKGEVIEITDESSPHAAVLQNFVDSLQAGSELLTPAEQGLGSLQLANGILLSAWKNETVRLPIDVNEYEVRLQEKIAGASLRKPKDLIVEIDMEKSYR
jgi:predicted dehydrogenase